MFSAGSAALMLFVSAIACDNTVTALGNIAGTYVATTMVIAVGEESINMLAIGEELTVVINEDGSHDGVLHNVLNDSGPTDEGLPGSVVRKGDLLVFHSSNQNGTILTDHTWTIQGSTILGVVKDGDYTSHITLTRQ